MQGPAAFYTRGLSPGVRLRLFGLCFKKRGPKQPKAPFFKTGLKDEGPAAFCTRGLRT